MEYFRKEWESGGERQALKTCLLALHSVRTEEEYKAQARELGADDELMSEVAEVLRVFAAKPGITVEKRKNRCSSGKAYWRISQRNRVITVFRRRERSEQ